MNERKFILSVVADGKTPERSKVKSLETRAQRFLHLQRYPLSNAGTALQREIAQAVAGNDSGKVNTLVKNIPTVETPRLDLFENLSLSEAEKRKIFTDTTNIQVTKGCSHDCLFCTVSASNKVETMPFAAVLKIAEALTPFRQHIFKKLLADLMPEARKLKKNSNIPVKEIAHTFAIYDMPPVTNFYDSDPFDYRDPSFLHTDDSPADFGDVANALVSPLLRLGITTAGFRRSDPVGEQAVKKLITLKKDCLAGKFQLDGKPLGFNPFCNVRLSINKYESRARRDLRTYRDEMLHTIDVMEPLNPEILLFSKGYFEPSNLSVEDEVFLYLHDPDYHRDIEKLKRYIPDEEDRDFFTQVILPISEHVQKKRFSQVGFKDTKLPLSPTRISFFSGPMQRKEMIDEYHDPGQCMPGYHIWPDGSIALQEKIPDEQLDQMLIEKAWSIDKLPSRTVLGNRKKYLLKYNINTVPRGARPQKTAMRLFKLKEKT